MSSETGKVSKAREAELLKAIREARALAKEAKNATPSAWTAASTLFKAEQSLRKELAQHRAAMTSKTPEAVAADMTPEEWAERLRVQAGSLTDLDLDVFVREWTSRNKLTAVHQQDGSVHLVRKAG